MSGPKSSAARPPAVAGYFYPADAELSRRQAAMYLQAARSQTAVRSDIGGLVPHAGWVCSAMIAARTLTALEGAKPQVVVIFGAVHRPQTLDGGALDPHQAWQVPGGELQVDQQLWQCLADQKLFVIDEQYHRREHAIEVQLPLIGQLWPEAKILPIGVAPTARAVSVGAAAALAASQRGLRVVFLASSDLTHYGPNYAMTSAGVGARGLAWAKENDRELLRRMEKMDAAAALAHTRSDHSACGGGAIAALIGAARSRGATRGEILAHTNSFETLAGRGSDENAVGYAAMIFS